MQVKPLSIDGAFLIEPVQHRDDRGVFLEWAHQEVIAEKLGHRFRFEQANCSVSRVGALRGIHFADIPPSQAKYVTCFSGAVFDVVVDIRVGSPTYGTWESVILDDVDRRALYIAEGLGHAFMALSDNASFVYLCSAPYSPGREHGVHPQDSELAIDWPTEDVNGRPLKPLLSPKDDAQPSLEEAAAHGLLPTMEGAAAFYDSLARG